MTGIFWTICTICFSIIVQDTAATTWASNSTSPDEFIVNPSTEQNGGKAVDIVDSLSQNPDTNNSSTIPVTASSQIFSQILYDDDGGHSKLWNPDSIANTFLINDTRISGSSSTIMVNIDQGTPSLVICVTSGIINGFFEISCTKPPLEGAQLRYAVIDAETLPPPSPSINKYLESRYGGNLSEDVKLGPLPSFGQIQESDIPILSQN